MQTHLADFIKDTPDGREAEAILRKCVHCGFCTATCPTYQLLGDELDSPRGRIYLIKGVLEGNPVTAKTRLHLDRCLTCRSCETTCPSGVQYGRLLDIGRELVEQRAPRGLLDKMERLALKEALPRQWLFAPALKLGRIAKSMLPAHVAAKLPDAAESGRAPPPRHARRMLVLAGCVQPSLAPSINAAASRVLDKLGISLVEAPGAGCCGALRFHLNDQDGGREDARRLIDAWWPEVERGVEAIVITASGCGVFVREYDHLLRHDPRYAAKAARIAALTRDVSEVVAAEKKGLEMLLAERSGIVSDATVAFHSPCSLQHGQQLRGVAEDLLRAAGFTVTPVADGHLCCGSAGTYSLLQPELATRLRDNKLAALQASGPQTIATANIGCLTHLAAGATLPVKHWIELIDQRLGA
jgi:glycolate oxidase iron-sulfur subunit